MRILHTSDWHLGARTGAVSRAADHDIFLLWLLDTLRSQAVDVLIIAGDIFDHAQPSAEAQRQYYRLLGAVEATGVRDVVVVGGNHDSASRLDAPAEVLATLDVHVVGGLPIMPEALATCLVPLRARGSDTPVGVCVAVPYVHEYRLGVRTTDPDAGAVRAAYREAFTGLYRGLVDEAQRRFPGLPVIGTGHLTLGADVTREDYPQPIHQVGYVEALSSEILDPRLLYVALGHIHRSGPVTKAAWYSGSPIALSVRESASPRRVLRVDVDGSTVVVQPIDIPVIREVVAFSGARAEVVADIGRLASAGLLPPLVQVRVVRDGQELTLDAALDDAMRRHPEERRPILVDRQTRAPFDPDAPPPERTLSELTPADVLRRMAAGRVDADALARALAELDTFDESDFEAHLLAVESG